MLYNVTRAADRVEAHRKSLGFELAILYGKVGNAFLLHVGVAR